MIARGVTLVALLLLLPILWEGTAGGTESSVEALLQAANQAYRNKEYQEAVQGYEQILETGIRHGVTEFNLANSYFRLGQLGKAILHYERAHRLLPRNRDILQNLNVARRQCEDQIEQEQSNAVVRFFAGIAFRLTANEWTGLTSAILFALGGVITARTFCQGLVARRRLRHIAVILVVVLVWFGMNAAVQINRLGQLKAVVLMPEVKVYAEPNPAARDSHLFLLHEGSKVRIVRSEGEWMLVRYAPGLRGWCEGPALEPI